MSNLRKVLAALMVALPLAAAATEAIYVTSVRSVVGKDATRVVGNLYRVDPDADRFALVGALRVDASTPIAVTGLSNHPVTGALYGVTSDLSPNHARSLVIINPKTAEATVVGPLGAIGSDLVFDSHGNLYAWLRETGRLALIDIASGEARPIGPARKATEIGGLGIDSRDRLFVASTGPTGTLDTIDSGTGAISTGPQLHGAPYPGGINSLTMAPSGDFFAVNTNLGSPAITALVRIEPATGRVTKVARLPNDTDALVFANDSWSLATLFASRGAVTLGAAILVACVALGALMLSHRRQGRRPGD